MEAPPSELITSQMLHHQIRASTWILERYNQSIPSIQKSNESWVQTANTNNTLRRQTSDWLKLSNSQEATEHEMCKRSGFWGVEISALEWSFVLFMEDLVRLNCGGTQSWCKDHCNSNVCWPSQITDPLYNFFFKSICIFRDLSYLAVYSYSWFHQTWYYLFPSL